MFAAKFTAELANRIGSRVEVATDNNLIEGILSTVTADLAWLLMYQAVTEAMSKYIFQ